LEYTKENYISGVKTYDFELPANAFYNSTLNPENIGFCSNDCLGNGVMDLSNCYGGKIFFNKNKLIIIGIYFNFFN